jgi:YD repeat-containing protein
MPKLSIRHETRYAYDRPVGFGLHRLLVRPRDSHALRVVSARLTVSPAGETRWLYDALGNSVCRVTPGGEARALSIISELVIERYPASLDESEVEGSQTATPVVYASADRATLAPFIAPASADPDSVLLTWLRDHTGGPHERAPEFLLRLNRTICEGFDYQPRDLGAAHEPDDTIKARSGTCRDFAWLMVEALRRLGYAARFVTGYLHSPAQDQTRGAGSTHAWCQVFLPELGWAGFDPTNGLAESPDLIPVAVTRTPQEAAPVSGSIVGDPGNTEMTVRVEVRPAGPLHAAA